jgi:hypothetical protein
MFKKIISLTLSVLVAIAPMQSQAIDLTGSFNSLMASGGGSVSTNSPGAFSSQARAGFTGGGVEIRIPRQSGAPSLLSITPPKIEAGCNGISSHFGGFSFISAQAFGDLLKKIASGAALGFVSSLVMKTLCPACEAIVSDLKAEAAKAAQLARNSCQWGQEQGRAFRAGLSESLSKSQLCSTNEASENGNLDSLAAWAGLCNTTESAVDTMKTRAGISTSASSNPGSSNYEEETAKNAQLLCTIAGGNLTWNRLAVFDSSESSDEDSYRRKLMLLNILGATIAKGGTDDVTTCEYKSGQGMSTATLTAGEDTLYCVPQADTKVLSSLFLCGAPDIDGAFAKNSSSRIREYCQAAAGQRSVVKDTYKIWKCDEPVKCSKMTLTSPDALISGEGFLVTVNKLLLEAVNRVRTDTGFDDADGRQIMKLIQVAPYPLYQAINAAAVYPAAALDLLDTMSILVAEQFTYALLDETLTVNNRVNSTVCPMSEAQASKMLDFMSALRVENKNRTAMMGQNLVTQQALTRQIQELNLAIQQQVLSEDLMSTGRLAETINQVVIPKSKPQQ